MRIAELRAECPDWQWRAERSGFGWRYVGERDGRTVSIRAFAVLCGPMEDDFSSSQWYVDDGERSETYTSWWIRELGQ